MRSEIKAVLALAGLAAACSDRPAGAAGAARGKKETVRMEQGTNGRDGVRDLPSSFGRSFATLDDYLGHLRDHAGPIDLPWYRQIRPGIYEYVTSIRPASPTRTYTREELMRTYGFSR
ncbi:MAG TPA: hypothetical protein VF645_07655 [Allosphingosinicella sp.]